MNRVHLGILVTLLTLLGLVIFWVQSAAARLSSYS